MRISKSIHIEAPISKVFTTYADILKWKEVMDDVVDVNVLYDDSRHQEFDMTVKRGETLETVHSIRFCNPFSSIEIFQTTPPPIFKKMSGVWSFEESANGTLVHATRDFEVLNHKSFQAEILEKFLQKNIESFKKWIEMHV